MRAVGTSTFTLSCMAWYALPCCHHTHHTRHVYTAPHLQLHDGRARNAFIAARVRGRTVTSRSRSQWGHGWRNSRSPFFPCQGWNAVYHFAWEAIYLFWQKKILVKAEGEVRQRWITEQMTDDVILTALSRGWRRRRRTCRRLEFIKWMSSDFRF